MWRLCVLGVLACSTAGCDQIFGLGKTSVVDAAIGGSCSGSAACEGTTVCDTTTDTCVKCTLTQAAACTGNEPLCGADDMCHGCVEHSDCPSDVCLASGACGDAADIAYVTSTGIDPGSTNTSPCTQASPCATIDGALTTHLPTIKVRGSILASSVIPDGVTVTIIGDDDAQLHGNALPTIEIEGNAVVTLRDLLIASGSHGVEISDGSAAPTVTIIHCQLSNNNGNGLRVDSGTSPTVTLAQSKIEKNLHGGIALDLSTGGSFQIVGNSFFGNGAGSSSIGGAQIVAITSGNRLDFNTFAGNQAQSIPGLKCSTPALVASSNIIADNMGMTGSTNIAQVEEDSNCTFRYTLTFPVALAGPGADLDPAAMNMNTDPGFASLTSGDLHFGATAPAAANADPSASITGIGSADPDGKTRTAPPDRGAFEHTN